MYFYEFILVMLFICSSKPEDIKSIITGTGIDAISQCSVGIVFFIKFNNTSNEDYHVEVTPDVCCLKDEKNCDILKIIGGCTCLVPGGNAKLIKLIAPIQDPYERQGYCTVYVDLKSNSQINKKETFKIHFNTTLQKNKYESEIKHCRNKDEDQLNDGEPVDCNKFYNRTKSFYNRTLKKYVGVPPYFVTEKTHSNIVDNLVSNKYITKSIVKRNIKALKRSLSYKDNERHAKDVIIITNGTEFTNDAIDLISVTYPQHIVKNNGHILEKIILKYFKNHKWVVVLLGSIIIIQCTLICTICCLRSTCLSEKKVVQKFFNSFQEDSAITPLIGTSNTNTATTQNQFLSESSPNVAKLSKSYKACEKENENIKISISDDILSKCLKRRDWKNHYKSERVENESNIDVNKIEQIILKHKDRQSEKAKTFNENIKLKDDENKDDKGVNSNIDLNTPSDEIKCQNCNSYDIKTDYKIISEKKSDSLIKSKVTLLSSEKAAQTYLSKDSIDAILSERGYIYLAAGDLSKYTSSSDSGKVKSLELLNKASKSVIKYFHNLLQGRSKHGSHSDPGKEKDLQLLHMSKASLYSSRNDSD